jgi:hypothetical protein
MPAAQLDLIWLMQTTMENYRAMKPAIFLQAKFLILEMRITTEK